MFQSYNNSNFITLMSNDNGASGSVNLLDATRILTSVQTEDWLAAWAFIKRNQFILYHREQSIMSASSVILNHSISIISAVL
jgi:hypothetical protein